MEKECWFAAWVGQNLDIYPAQNADADTESFRCCFLRGKSARKTLSASSAILYFGGSIHALQEARVPAGRSGNRLVALVSRVRELGLLVVLVLIVLVGTIIIPLAAPPVDVPTLTRTP